MRKVSIAIGIGVACGAIAPLACDDFEASEAPQTDAGSDSTEGGDTGLGSDSSAEPDGTVTVDAGPDASVRTVTCGEEKCLLPKEVCCLFFGGATPSFRFCAEGTCPNKSPNDAGYTSRAVVSCDDPTDCDTPGNVCCAASTGGCTTSALSVVECRAPGNCATCVNDDAGVGFHLCRSTVTTDCSSSAQCSGAFASPERFGDYRFCK